MPGRQGGVPVVGESASGGVPVVGGVSSSEGGGGGSSITTMTRTWLHKTDSTYSRARPKYSGWLHNFWNWGDSKIFGVTVVQPHSCCCMKGAKEKKLTPLLKESCSCKSITQALANLRVIPCYVSMKRNLLDCRDIQSFYTSNCKWKELYSNNDEAGCLSPWWGAPGIHNNV